MSTVGDFHRVHWRPLPAHQSPLRMVWPERGQCCGTRHCPVDSRSGRTAAPGRYRR